MNKIKKRKENSISSLLKNGIFTNNPLLVALMGVCPALAISTSVYNGIAMGAVVTAVLLLSNLTVSLIRISIPEKVRIPIYMIVIAGYVTAAELLLKAFLPEVDNALGFYVSLVVVNCVVLSRCEQHAGSNKVFRSLIDAFANGIGYTLALVVLSAIREILGSGEILGFDFAQYIGFKPMSIMVLPAGGFLVLGFLCALLKKIRMNKEGKNA